MADDPKGAPVVLVGWTDDDLDYLAEVVEVEHTIAAALEADGPRVTVVRPGRREAQAQGAAPVTDRLPAAAARAPAPPRLAVTKEVAGAMLSMSVDSLERHVMPHVRSIRVGGLVRIPISEIERWVIDSAGRALGDR